MVHAEDIKNDNNYKKSTSPQKFIRTKPELYIERKHGLSNNNDDLVSPSLILK